MTTPTVTPVDPAAFWTAELILILAVVTALMAWVVWDVIAPFLRGRDE